MGRYFSWIMSGFLLLGVLACTQQNRSDSESEAPAEVHTQAQVQIQNQNQNQNLQPTKSVEEPNLPAEEENGNKPAQEAEEGGKNGLAKVSVSGVLQSPAVARPMVGNEDLSFWLITN